MTKLSRHQSWRSEQVAGQVDLPFKEEEETTFPDKTKVSKGTKRKKRKIIKYKKFGEAACVQVMRMGLCWLLLHSQDQTLPPLLATRSIRGEVNLVPPTYSTHSSRFLGVDILQ